MSLFAPAPPTAPAPAPPSEGTDREPPARTAAGVAPATVTARRVPSFDTPHLLVRVGTTSFAFPVAEVREVLRATQVRVLGRSTLELQGRPVAHVDVRGRTVPVVDLRSDPTRPGDVLLPLWRRQAGVVVDRVVAVLAPDDLVVEPGAALEALPAYAHGVARTVDDGSPVLLVALPELPEGDQT